MPTVAMAPFRPRRLAVVASLILSGATIGIVLLAWPLPSPPAVELSATDTSSTLELVDRYAAVLELDGRAAAFDPDGHASLVAERAAARSRDRSPSSAFLLLDAARRHADATVFPRWTAIFALVLCIAAGVMALWRARRTTDPGPTVNLEAVGVTVAATLISAFLVGWTAKITSTAVTAFTASSCAALMITGRVIPRVLVGAGGSHFRRIAAGITLGVLGVLGRRGLAPAPDASGGEIVLRAIPMLLCTSVIILGMLLASSNVAVLVMRAPASKDPPTKPD